ncbi:MAG: transcription elongation factor GreA [Chloroflexi bacterium]|nr:MAG: transcription elongation factor GreA [Chloroflexota bacterium]
MAERITAIEALQHFENSLATEPEKARVQMPVITQFVGIIGNDRQMSAITAAEVGRYVREHTDGSVERIEPLRAFLAHAARLAFTETNLVFALRLGNAGGLGGGDGNELGGNAYHVTFDGLQRLEQQIAEEKSRRPEIAQKLHDAMQDKDFRENAPLDAARDEQAHLEARIRDLESRLRNAVIIDETAKGGKANVGSVVNLLNLKTNKEQTFMLVSPNEVDPASGKISVASPIGVAVMNHPIGDEVTVNAPSGAITFRVVDVQG